MLAAVVVLGLCVAASPGGEAAPATAGALTAIPERAIAGERVALAGWVPPRRSRPVLLQRMRGDSWVTVARQRASSTGRFAFVIRAQTSTTTYRVLAPRTTIGGHTYRAVQTPHRTVTTLAQRAELDLPATARAGRDVTATATIQPARPGRTVKLQRWTGSWQVEDTAKEGRRGRVVFTINRPRPGTFRYRVVAVAADGAARVASPAEKIVITDGPPHRFITRVSANGRHLLDQVGDPIMLRGDTNWAIVFNAGRWGGGSTWQSDMDAYLGARAAQGFNTVYVAALGNTINGGVYDTGATWDGVSPWVGGSTSDIGPDVGKLNNAYWSRVDHLLDTAASVGITVMLDVIYGDDIGENARPGAMYESGGGYPTNAQMTTYGTMLGTRYKDYRNVIWMIGGDYWGNADPKVALTLDAIRAAGAHQLISVENAAPSTSYTTTLGHDYAQWSDVYTYGVTYRDCEKAWREKPTIPVVWIDGYYDNESGPSNQLLYRQLVGWALTSGSRGTMYAVEGLWQWSSSALDMTQHPNVTAGDVREIWNAVSALSGWQRLVPDIGSTKLLTGSRGTKVLTDTLYTSPTNNYVTGSITPDGSLALVYLPRGGTVDVTWANLRPKGRRAHWLDPTTGALTSAAPGATSYTPPHPNAAGQPDWLLVLRAG